MSVITSHCLSSKEMNLEKELKEQGFVYEGDLYSRKGNRNIHLENIFDFKKCCPELAEEYMTDLKEKGWKSLNENDEWVRHEYTEQELNDACKMPVVFNGDGAEMVWCLNYGHNDYPADAVSKHYPDITFDYFRATEGHTDFDIKIKNTKEIERFNTYLIGNLGTEPEVKMVDTKNGKRAVTNAVLYTKNKEEGKPNIPMQISAWGEYGEKIGAMHKGDSLGVSGNVKISEKDGKTYYNVYVRGITYEKSKSEQNKTAKKTKKSEVER